MENYNQNNQKPDLTPEQRRLLMYYANTKGLLNPDADLSRADSLMREAVEGTSLEVKEQGQDSDE